MRFRVENAADAFKKPPTCCALTRKPLFSTHCMRVVWGAGNRGEGCGGREGGDTANTGFAKCLSPPIPGLNPSHFSFEPTFQGWEKQRRGGCVGAESPASWRVAAATAALDDHLSPLPQTHRTGYPGWGGVGRGRGEWSL